MRDSLRQILVVSWLNFKGLRRRPWSSLVIVASVACVVTVLVSVLSLTAGIRRSYMREGGTERILVLSAGASNLNNSQLPIETVNVVMNSPGVKKTADGVPLADQEVISNLPAAKKYSGLGATLTVRGFGPKGLLLHPNLRIIAGRMFRSGTNEAIVGIGAQRQFADLAVGNSVRLQKGSWPIVGTFEADGDILEGQLIGDASQIMPAVGRKAYSTVVLDLASADQFGRFKYDLALNPNLKVTAERQSDYYARTTGRFSGFFDTVAFVLGGLMAVGAVFGTINTLYSAVSTRSREIATLRALGFSAVAVAASVILEALFLSLTGAIIGASSAWELFNDQQKVLGSNVFSLSVTFSLAGIGIIFAVTIALIGAALPSVRAAKVPIPTALRAV
jgi:putative ABC transport system permease protein